MEEEIVSALPEQPETAQVVDVQFRPGQKVYYFDPAGLTLRAGDPVIIDTARGPEFGTCTAGNHAVRMGDVVAPLRPVLRLATAQDLRIVEENREREKRAYNLCLQKIESFGLDMQLVSAECAFDGGKILFFFTADERVDFRELVKSLASAFHTRIELRQIGVRDKAKMVGGLGICGRPFCCTTFLEEFQPVSIKMAKTQNLSLNPTKISGTCGRLMCCLKYEQEAYEDLLRTSPKAESFVDTPEGRGTVLEVNLLRQQVRVRMETQPDTIQTFAVSEIAVLRNGRAKKNDLPIPSDLAPISGGGKIVRKEPEEAPMVLEPIRFRYSTEQIVEEPAPRPESREMPETPAQENPERPDRGPEQKPRQSGTRRRRKPETTEGGAGKPAGQPRRGRGPAPKGDRPDRGPKPEGGEQKPRPSGPRPERTEKTPGARNERPQQPRPDKPRVPAEGNRPEGQPAADAQPRSNRRRDGYRRSHRPRKPDGQGTARPDRPADKPE